MSSDGDEGGSTHPLTNDDISRVVSGKRVKFREMLVRFVGCQLTLLSSGPCSVASQCLLSLEQVPGRSCTNSVLILSLHGSWCSRSVHDGRDVPVPLYTSSTCHETGLGRRTWLHS